jgi:hypothetical protein
MQHPFFIEWQEWMRTHPEEMKQKVKRWEEIEPTILTLSLSEQAEYADFITQKMCTLKDAEFLSFANNIVGTLSSIKEPLNACAIGNLAALIQRAPSPLKETLHKEFTAYCNLFKQKYIDAPSIKT